MTSKKPNQDVLLNYVREIDRFAVCLRETQERITELERDCAEKREAFEAAKAAVREEKDLEHSAVTMLLKFIAPGKLETFPLLDKMEPADEDKHGSGSAEWRKEPISVLRLSAAATAILVAADVVLVGQLQDAMLANRDWWTKIDGMSAGVADAVELKLNQYIAEQVSK